MRIQDRLRLAVQPWFVSLLLLFRIEFVGGVDHLLLCSVRNSPLP
jgi:hypothetical protein